MLALSVAQIRNQGGQANRHAFHDVGSANAQLSFQAVADGLYVHQMAGFDATKRARFSISPTIGRPSTAMAIGYPGDPQTLPDKLQERELAPRTRKPLSEFVMTGDLGAYSYFRAK